MWSARPSCGGSISFAAPRSRLSRRHGIDRNAVRRALRSDEPPRYQRPTRPSMLGPFKDEIHRLLADEPVLTAVRIRELMAPLGSTGSKTIVDDTRATSGDSQTKRTFCVTATVGTPSTATS